MTTVRQGPSECFDDALDNLLGMSDVLRNDMESLLDAFRDDQESQVLRRTCVRASWAYVEAITHASKNMIEILADASACELESKDREFLEQQKPETLKNIKLTIRLVTKVFDVPERDLGGGSDWCHVTAALKLRNRLVHPKSAARLKVDDSEWECHRLGFVWLVRTFDGLLRDISDKFG